MATKEISFVNVDEDYIDIELSSPSPNFFSYSIGSPLPSPPQNREFEFQNKKESTTTSPADELFYKGKLLPLHLPPRLQMVQKLLQNADSTFGYVRSHSSLEDSSFPFHPTSAKISPSESQRVSSSDAYEYLFDWNTEIVGDVTKKLPCSKKLKHKQNTKHFWLSQRLKASRAYIKSLFGKSGCSDKCCASDATKAVKKSKCKQCEKDAKNNNSNNNNKNTFDIFYDSLPKRSCAVKKSISNNMVEDGFNVSRRSFSGVIQRHYASKASPLSSSSSGSSSSSSSFSLSSSGSSDLHLFNKGICVNSDLKSSIQSAIAHCKKSQQQSSSSDKNCSNSQSLVCGNQEIGNAWLNQRGSGRVDKDLVEK